MLKVYTASGVILAQKTLSVVWVNIILQTTPHQAFAADNSAGPIFAKYYGPVLGPAVTHPFGGGTFCSIDMQYTGIVTPSNYKGMIYLSRKLLGARQWADLSSAPFAARQDDSATWLLDPDPQSGGSNGKVYDLDGPGTPTFDPAVVYRLRSNFVEYAVLDHLGKDAIVVSDQLPTYARNSCKGVPASFLPDGDSAQVLGDDQAGIGSTPTTVNLQ